MNENRIGRCLLPVSVTDRAVKNSGGYLPLPIVGEDGQPSGWPGEGPMCPPCPSRNPPVSFPRKQEPRLLCVRPFVSFPRKQEPTQCPSYASSSPVRLSPPREWPAVPKAPPGEGATVSFPRKRESSRCHSRASGNPGSFGYAPWCHSRVSSTPGSFAPTPRVIPA